MIPELTATRFLKVMDSGRTQPCLLVGEDAEGNEVEAVVKLKGHPQMMPGGMVAEAMASILATDLGLPVPLPYRMRIEKAFAQTVPNPILRGHLEKTDKIADYLLNGIPNFDRIKIQLQSLL